MFSLIITIISIALVAALALATLYYGGAAFNKSAAAANAARLVNQHQQLQGAAELYKADTGAYPLSLAAMTVDSGHGIYLKSIPVAHLENAPSGVGTAQAAEAAWVMVSPGQPVFAVTPVEYDSCAALNRMAYGTEGVLQRARPSLTLQCTGSDAAALTVVSAKSAQAFNTAATAGAPAVALGTASTAPIPAVTDTSVDGWLVPPTTSATPTTPQTPADFALGAFSSLMNCVSPLPADLQTFIAAGDASRISASCSDGGSGDCQYLSEFDSAGGGGFCVNSARSASASVPIAFTLTVDNGGMFVGDSGPQPFPPRSYTVTATSAPLTGSTRSMPTAWDSLSSIQLTGLGAVAAYGTYTGWVGHFAAGAPLTITVTNTPPAVASVMLDMGDGSYTDFAPIAGGTASLQLASAPSGAFYAIWGATLDGGQIYLGQVASH